MKKINNNSKPSLAPYQALIKKLRPKIGFKSTIVVKQGKGWFFDHKPGNRKITIHVPPHDFKYTAPIFVHYLASAKIIEDGWPRFNADIRIINPKLAAAVSRKPKDELQRALQYFASRPEDAFLDFNVWLLLRKHCGTTWFKRFVTPTFKREDKVTLKILGTTPKDRFTDYYRYCYFIDWYAAIRTLAGIYKMPEVQKKLDRTYRLVMNSGLFSAHFTKKIKSTLPKLRKFYRNVSTRYHSHNLLLKNKIEFYKIFMKYYREVWSDLDLNISLVIREK